MLAVASNSAGIKGVLINSRTAKEIDRDYQEALQALRLVEIRAGKESAKAKRLLRAQKLKSKKR